jgi:hypothetical protein
MKECLERTQRSVEVDGDSSCSSSLFSLPQDLRWCALPARLAESIRQQSSP